MLSLERTKRPRKTGPLSFVAELAKSSTDKAVGNVAGAGTQEICRSRIALLAEMALAGRRVLLSAMTRENILRERLARRSPDLTVDLYLYPTEAGGRRGPIGLGWGCPCSKDDSLKEGWDGYPLLQSEMMPGERRRLGFVFLSGAEAVASLRSCERFFLWEGRLIGEAEIVL